MSFLFEMLLPAIAKLGKLMDAAHLGGVREYGLSLECEPAADASGVLGALNFVAKKVETITNDTYSQSVVLMLEKLATKYVGKPIVIFLDNARYQTCNLVKRTSQLLFLPIYSPNLNLIERVWKFVKSKLLGAAYIDSFQDYSNNISAFIDALDSDNLTKMNSIVNENFQLFHNCHILNA